MKKHLNVVLVLAAFLSLGNAAAMSQPKPEQAPKNSREQALPQTRGGRSGGSGSLTGLGDGSSGGGQERPGVGSGVGSSTANGVGGGGSPSHGSGGEGRGDGSAGGTPAGPGVSPGEAANAGSGVSGSGSPSNGTDGEGRRNTSSARMQRVPGVGPSRAASAGRGVHRGRGTPVITVISSGSRPVQTEASRAPAIPAPAPQEAPKNSSDEGLQPNLRGCLGGRVRVGGSSRGGNGGGLGGGLADGPAGRNRGGLGSTTGGVGGGPAARAGGAWGIGDLPSGQQGTSSGSRGSGGRHRSPGNDLTAVSTSREVSGPREEFPAGLDGEGSVGIPDGELGVPRGGTSGSVGVSGLSSSNRGVDGGSVTRAARAGGLRRDLQSGLGFGSDSSARGGSNRNSINGFSTMLSSSRNSGLGESFPAGLGTSESPGDSDVPVRGHGGSTSGSAGSGFGNLVSGQSSGGGGRGGGATAAGARVFPGPAGGRGFGRGSSASSGSNGSPEGGLSFSGSSTGSSGSGDEFPPGLGAGSLLGNSAGAVGRPGGGSPVSSQFGSPVSGLASPISGVGGGGYGSSGGAGRISGVASSEPRQGLDVRPPTSGSSSITPGRNLSTSSTSMEISDKGDGVSPGLGDGSSRSNYNGDVAGHGVGTSGYDSSGGSHLASHGAGFGSPGGTGGEAAGDDRGMSGGAGEPPGSLPESGPESLSEGEPGIDGTTDGTADGSSNDAGSSNSDSRTSLSSPVGNGSGVDLPRLPPAVRGGRRLSPAATAAATLGALAGVAAVGALSAGIVAVVQSSRRRGRPRSGARRNCAGCRGRKPCRSRCRRQRRSISESKVPAEILDQIPMNFERLY